MLPGDAHFHPFDDLSIGPNGADIDFALTQIDLHADGVASLVITQEAIIPAPLPPGPSNVPALSVCGSAALWACLVGALWVVFTHRTSQRARLDASGGDRLIRATWLGVPDHQRAGPRCPLRYRRAPTCWAATPTAPA